MKVQPCQLAEVPLMRKIHHMSNQDQLQLTLRSISIDGLEADDSATAKRELQMQFEFAQKLGVTLRKPTGVTIQIAGNLEHAVDHFNQSQGIEGHPYKQERPGGISCGILLTEHDGTSSAEYLLILDAEFWSAQTLWNIVLRTYGVAYLVSELANRVDADRMDIEVPSFKGRHAESLWHTSLALCSSLGSSMYAANFCNTCIKDGEGNPVELSALLETCSPDAVSDYLDQLCVFATFDVAFYRIFSMDLDGLYPTSMSLVCGLLQCILKLIPLYAVLDQLKGLIEMLSVMNGYREFLDPVWNDIMAACATDDLNERLDLLSSTITKMMGNAGLRVEDLDDGTIYLHVHEPVPCSWEDRNDEDT